jgi:hypothetical protein
MAGTPQQYTNYCGPLLTKKQTIKSNSITVKYNSKGHGTQGNLRYNPDRNLKGWKVKEIE